jgi:hypothetical protein
LKTALCVGLIVALLGVGAYFGTLAFYAKGDAAQTDIDVATQRSGPLPDNSLQGSNVIGSIQAPMDFKELLFLLKNDPEFDDQLFDRSQHFESTSTSGAVLHCGLVIGGTSVLVECETGQDFCDVYDNVVADGC